MAGQLDLSVPERNMNIPLAERADGRSSHARGTPPHSLLPRGAAGCAAGRGLAGGAPALAWAVVGVGCLSLAALVAAGPQKNGLVSLLLVPLLACMAVGVALGRLALSGLLRGVILACATIAIVAVCALNTAWEI